MEEQAVVDTETQGRGDAENRREDGEIDIRQQATGNWQQATEFNTQRSALSARNRAQDAAPSAQRSESSADSSGLSSELELLRGELEGAKARQLESHRRALLAENAGRIVAELVTGSTVEELERSVEVARQAFDTAKAAAITELSAQHIPAGNPVRQGPNLEGMSPFEKIAYGLKRD